MADMRKIANFFRKISVVDCGLPKMRVGRPNDGGYVVLPDICKQTDQILTFGVGDDVSFEEDFVTRFPQVTRCTLCDPTIESLPGHNEKFIHVRKYAHQLYPEAFREHTGRTLLKIDIEWHEWDLLKRIKPNYDLKNFSQILIEFHLFNVSHKQNGYSPYFNMVMESFTDEVNIDLFEKYEACLDKLLENFHIFHIHANNSLPVTRIDGIEYPPLLELSLVRKNVVREVEDSKETFPAPIDRPNKTDRPDIENYYPIRPWKNNGLQRHRKA